MMICPCRISATKLLEVIDQEDNIVILKVLGSDQLTVVYEKDLEPVYEKN